MHAHVAKAEDLTSMAHCMYSTPCTYTCMCVRMYVRMRDLITVACFQNGISESERFIAMYVCGDENHYYVLSK